MKSDLRSHLTDTLWEGVSSSSGLPTVEIEEVIHIGDLSQKPKKRHMSYEGPGLSVSVHPDEWEMIAKLGGGNHYIGVRKDGKPGKFALVYKMRKDQGLMTKVKTFMQSKKYMQPGKVWRALYRKREYDYTSLEKARQAEGDRKAITEIDTLVPTQKMTSWWNAEFSTEMEPYLWDEMALWLYVHDNTDLDGMWWASILNVEKLSAPAGVIFPDRLSKWHFEDEDERDCREAEEEEEAASQ